MVLLGKQAGVELIHVPYRGGGPALNDAISGHVDLIIGSAALLMPQIENAGAIQPVFQLGPTRLPALQDVPSRSRKQAIRARRRAPGGAFSRRPARRSPMIERFRTAFVDSLREERVARQLTETQQVSLVLSGPRGAAQVRHRTGPHLERGGAEQQHQVR